MQPNEVEQTHPWKKHNISISKTTHHMKMSAQERPEMVFYFCYLRTHFILTVGIGTIFQMLFYIFNFIGQYGSPQIAFLITSPCDSYWEKTQDEEELCQWSFHLIGLRFFFWAIYYYLVNRIWKWTRDQVNSWTCCWQWSGLLILINNWNVNLLKKQQQQEKATMRNVRRGQRQCRRPELIIMWNN